MKNKISELLKTPKGKLILACIAMVVVWGILLFPSGGESSEWLPDDNDFEQIKSELKKAKAEQQSVFQRKKQEDRLRDRLQQRINVSWIESIHGDVEMNLREMVSSVIQKHEDITLSSLGSVRTSKLNNDLFFAELDLTFSGELEQVLELLQDLQAIRPALSWKRAELQLDFQRRNNTAQTTETTKTVKKTNIVTTEVSSDENMRFNGTLRILCTETEPAVTKKGTEKK